MKFTLVKGTALPFGDTKATLTKDAEFDFAVPSTDALAETLAACDASTYAAHRDALAHEEGVEREGEIVTVVVTYGVAGARQEEIKAEEEKPQKKK